jgi:hypothetical protein
MWPALPAPEYYGGSAPPGPFSGRRAYPRPELAARQQGTATGRFPRSLSFARRRRSPAVSQRHRHEYAADLPHGLPGPVKEPPREVPAARRYGGTHRARPLSTRFEPVYGLKDVTAPVPRVLLSATLAGPAPSGSTGHVPALSGLLPPSPAPPGSGIIGHDRYLLRPRSAGRSGCPRVAVTIPDRPPDRARVGHGP